MSECKSNTDYAVKPGETIAETIERLGMTRKEFACRLGITTVSLNRIESGVQPITVETAFKLELATGVKATFWLKLEAQYRSDLERIQLIQKNDGNRNWLRMMPRAELRRRGLINRTTDGEEFARLLEFFGVASVSAWEQIWCRPELAARKSNACDTEFPALAAWIRMGERLAQDMNCAAYSAAAFNAALVEIKSIACKPFSEQSLLDAQALCAKCGVALVFVKSLPKVPLNGAARWLSPEKAMIMLSLRGKSEDKIWFSFFHEASHILQDGKKLLYVSGDDSDSPEEQRANQYAAAFLIPDDWNSEIKGFTTPRQCSKLAAKLGIPASIVMGRYGFLTGNWRRFQSCLPVFTWPEGVWCLMASH